MIANFVYCETYTSYYDPSLHINDIVHVQAFLNICVNYRLLYLLTCIHAAPATVNLASMCNIDYTGTVVLRIFMNCRPLSHITLSNVNLLV